MSKKPCKHCGGPLHAEHLWCPGAHYGRNGWRDMWSDFCEGDWYSFWTGGPVRNAIYEPLKRIILGLERWFDTLR